MVSKNYILKKRKTVLLKEMHAVIGSQDKTNIDITSQMQTTVLHVVVLNVACYRLIQVRRC